MPTASFPTSGALLRVQAGVHGFTSKSLAARLTAEGLPVTRQAVESWFGGGGIRDSARPVLCRVLGIDIGHLSTALAARPTVAAKPADPPPSRGAP